MLAMSLNSSLMCELDSNMREAISSTLVHMEVRSVLDEMVYDIEIWDRKVHELKLQHELQLAIRKQEQEKEEIKTIEYEKDLLQLKLDTLRSKAHDLGEMFHLEMKNLMHELSQKKQLEKDLDQARATILDNSKVAKELAETQRELREIHRKISLQTMSGLKSPVRRPTVQSSVPVVHPFCKFEDHILITILANLEPSQVLVFSQLSHPIMNRLNRLFGMKNTLSQDPIRRASPGLSRMNRVEKIVSSMNKTEVKLFHDMATENKHLKSSLGQVFAEKEDLTARLHGAENVKDFLMEKLKEVEDALATALDEARQAEEKSASDREVIGFLDARTQQLETSLKKLSGENKKLTAQLQQEETSHVGHTAVIEDMVQLLSTEKNELQQQAKAQRKLLVREVKSLRSQLHKITTERDLFRKQLLRLRDSLLQLD